MNKKIMWFCSSIGYCARCTSLVVLVVDHILPVHSTYEYTYYTYYSLKMQPLRKKLMDLKKKLCLSLLVLSCFLLFLGIIIIIFFLLLSSLNRHINDSLRLLQENQEKISMQVFYFFENHLHCVSNDGFDVDPHFS